MTPDGPRHDTMTGRTIGNYVITAELARGGMGILYRARHITLPREAVVKCIRAEGFSDKARSELRTRFKREAHIQSQFDDPHIVRVYEFYAEEDDYFLVMEYIHGSSLRALLDEKHVLPVSKAVSFAAQALEGLAHAHTLRFVDEAGHPGNGIIHRDIKPANLLVDGHGTLKVTDFGIVKLLGEGQLTRTGFGPGTVEYMSPEQVRNLPLDARSDLYSIGVTLYEMLSGKVPFPRTPANSDFDVLRAHVETEPPVLRTADAALPPALAQVVARSLKKNSADRWQTATEFREALLSSAEQPAQAAKYSRRRVVGFVLVGLLTIAELGSIVWFGRRGFGRRSSEKASIAVLPFSDLSAEKNQAYFSEGLAEELLNALSKIPQLRVAARPSAFRFTGAEEDPRFVGKRLNVKNILQGSVRKQGSHVKIGVRLISAADGASLWADSFDRELTDIFAVQEEIARAVTGALKVTLLGDKPATPKSANAEAYNAYLQGRYFLARRTQGDLEKAATYFQQAINLDSRFAPAWVGLGECRSYQAGPAYIPTEEGYRKAREAVTRALELDPNLGTAHAAMGAIKRLYDWDWAGADAAYQRALSLEPDNANIIGGAAALARDLGRFDQAITLYRHALEIDPLNSSVSTNAGTAYYKAGRYVEAKAAYQKALELFPQMWLTHGLLGRVYLAESRPQEALAEAESEKNPVFHLFGLALAHHALGNKRLADAELAEFISKYRENFPYQVGMLYAFRREADKAFEWLERTYSQHDPGLSEMKGSPLLKNIEKDPRYAALLKKMGLPR